MANITVTHTFVNGTTADATEVNANFTDIINGTSDGTKDFSINALTVAGTANLNGAANLNGNITLGNATGDTITFTGRVASDIDPDTTATYSFGSTSLTYKDIYLDAGATDGGAIYFNAVNTSFIKSDAAGTDLDISGFTNLDINSLNITQAGSITATGTLTNTGAASLDGAVTINDSGAAVDFRVEGFTEANLIFADASTDRVGIGCATPDAPFHAQIDTEVAVTPPADTIGLFASGDSAGEDAAIAIISNGTGGDGESFLYLGDHLDVSRTYIKGGRDGHLKFTTESKLDAVTILNSGNVGIGTTSPAEALHVEGDAVICMEGTAGISSIGGTTGAGSTVSATTGTLVAAMKANTAFIIVTSATDGQCGFFVANFWSSTITTIYSNLSGYNVTKSANSSTITVANTNGAGKIMRLQFIGSGATGGAAT